MPFQINQGLAKFEFTDHYAILGVPIGASAGEIRKRYLKIAKNLHPDSREEDKDKQLASELFSKLVNPAYKVLSNDKDRVEYEVVLDLVGERLAVDKATIQLEFDLSRQLNKAANADAFYKQAMEKIAEQQYVALQETEQLVGQCSELNLVYLIRRKGGYVALPESSVSPLATGTRPPVTSGTSSTTSVRSTGTRPPGTVPPGYVATGNSQPLHQPTATTPPADQYVNQYYRRAEEFLIKNGFQAAIKELRDALKLDPQNSRCHSLMGTVYLRQNQLTMAKVHFTQALKFDPNNAAAKQGKAEVEKQEQKTQKSKPQAQAPPAKPETRGLFGLFGNKKK
jgi:tetratricopeptide (TPR) repeat protein